MKAVTAPEPRITELTVTPVRVPLREPMVTAIGDIRASEYAIIEITCDNGITGLGEISLIWHGNGARLGVETAPLLREAVVGFPVSHRGSIMTAAREALQFGRHSLTALAAVEMAVFDALGKHLGVPAHVLLGGARRERVPLSMSLSAAPIEAMLAQARRFIDDGFRALKIKGLRDGEHIERVAAGLRRDFADVSVRVDLNMACRTAKEALAIARRLEPLGIRSLEQPLPPDDLDGLSYLRAHTDIPIMLDESVWDERDAARAIDAHAGDIVNVYVAEAGGLSAALRIADQCALAGWEIAVGSMPELAVGTAAAAHLAVTAPYLEHPSDVAGFRYHAGDVVHHDLRIEDGELHCPQEPGLGVELDRDALAAHTMEVLR